jgi:multicomponent Na+:H+ antiporter subunit D
VQAGLGAGQYIIVAIALGVSLLTLFSMTKIWAEAFWKPAPHDRAASDVPPALTVRQTTALSLPIGFLAVLTVGIGIGAEPVFTLATRAAEQLLDRERYIRTVLELLP